MYMAMGRRFLKRLELASGKKVGHLLQIWEKDYNFANADRLTEAPLRG